ncbi:MAG: HAMP domain-containing histidine kinase [Prolixibacteraceae bacterium]|jgi:signal transduction histidine kinase|nr:HAMP domain-containing histidine kinase [Prolixibacteraceae bacterium]
MRLELKLALIGAFSKLVIFLILFTLVQQTIDSLALEHTDRDLTKKKDKALSIIKKIGIKTYLDAEQDSVFASYNILKDEYITITLDPTGKPEELTFSQEARIIEGEEFDFRILNYNFVIGYQQYSLEIGKNIQLIYSLDRTLKRISVSIILIVLVITILFDLGIYKYLLHPLNQMIIPKLKTVDNPESFDYTEIDSSTSDFVYLNTTINEMMHKVNEILKNQRKFIGDVSHELFTPISVMQSKLDNLLVSGKLPVKTIEMIVDQQKQLIRLQHIIKALLLISRIENDQYAKIDKVNLHELVGEIVANIEDRAQITNISLENRISKETTLLNVNKYLIYILLFNLVSNAIKYNKAGGSVLVYDEQTDSNLLVVVEDNGIGIAVENLDLIFNRFKRMETTKEEGQGLGLSIVNSIAEFHDATIEVKSQPGEGSKFIICFPFKQTF